MKYGISIRDGDSGKDTWQYLKDEKKNEDWDALPRNAQVGADEQL